MGCEMNEWISVEDRLPLEKKGRCIVFISTGVDGMGMAWFRKETYSQHNWAWVYKQINGTHFINNEQVTHWQPLPNPPEAT